MIKGDINPAVGPLPLGAYTQITRYTSQLNPLEPNKRFTLIKLRQNRDSTVNGLPSVRVVNS